MITACGVRHRHPGAPGEVLAGVDLDIATGAVTTLVGVNGSGKSTLLRILCGATSASAGTVTVSGLDPVRTPRRRFAREVAVMHQSLPPVPGLSVEEFVAQGRFAARGTFGMLLGGDRRGVDTALEEVGMAATADRRLDSLSGGERQRVRLAATLTQQSRVLMLDEPTAHLDVRHQLELLELVRGVAAARGLTVLMVLHDLDQAVRFSDAVVVLHDGRVHAEGAPGEVIDEALLREVFGVEGRVLGDPVRDSVLVVIDSPANRS